MAFIGIVIIITIIVLTVALLISMHEINGWRELNFCDWNLKLFLQTRGHIEKDVEYAIFMRDVYLPKKKEFETKETIEELSKRVVNAVCDAVIDNRISVAVLFTSRKSLEREDVVKAVKKVISNMKLELSDEIDIDIQKYDYDTIRIYIPLKP